MQEFERASQPGSPRDQPGGRGGEGPEQGWSEEKGTGYRVWLLSTQGGTPFMVVEGFSAGYTFWLSDGQLLAHDDAGVFTMDPQTRERHADLRWESLNLRYLCDPVPNPVRATEVLEGCWENRPHRERQSYLRILNVDGRPPITITQPFQSSDAFWSADGEKVLFDGGSVYFSRLFIWNRADGRLTQILGQYATRDYKDLDLSWSPDGRWLVFDGVANDLCVMTIATGDVDCFPHYVAPSTQSALWAPDSMAVAIFTRGITNSAGESGSLSWDLVVVRIPDGSVTQITDTHDAGLGYAWGR